MEEKIIGISEFHDKKLSAGEDYLEYDGYKIITDSQDIYVAISNGQSCCESWGFLTTLDDPEEFVGATLLKIERVDSALNVEQWNKEYEYGLDEGAAIFVNFVTDKGTFQVTVYNAHNGYYGHGAVVISNQLKVSTCL